MKTTKVRRRRWWPSPGGWWRRVSGGHWSRCCSCCLCWFSGCPCCPNAPWPPSGATRTQRELITEREDRPPVVGHRPIGREPPPQRRRRRQRRRRHHPASRRTIGGKKKIPKFSTRKKKKVWNVWPSGEMNNAESFLFDQTRQKKRRIVFNGVASSS